MKKRGRILIRALDIALYLIILQASIGFVNALEIFDENYYATQNNTFSDYQIGNAEKEYYQEQLEEPGLIDQAKFFLELAIDGLFAILKVFLAVIIIYPTLVIVFGVPAGLSALLQVGIWTMYVLGWNQYRSGKTLEYYT